MISNHGAGINEEFRDKVFDKFSQGDASDSRQKGGAGLGLAITKRLIEAMGGAIHFDSQPNSINEFLCRISGSVKNDQENQK